MVREAQQNSKDGTTLVYIPEGEFIAGSARRFKVRLPAYYIARTCVTNRQYKLFIDQTGYHPPQALWGEVVWRDDIFSLNKAEHPVVHVTWVDAQAYCKWAGLRLPTELEWEKAARGTDGRIYPWGDIWDPSRCCNNTFDATCPVESYPYGASPWGILQMAGNVQEWCADFFDFDVYELYRTGKLTPRDKADHRVPAGTRVIRGGDWFQMHRTPTLADPEIDVFECASRCGMRSDDANQQTGFRCARDVEDAPGRHMR